VTPASTIPGTCCTSLYNVRVGFHHKAFFSELSFHCITKDFIAVLCERYCVYARDASGNIVLHHVPMATGSLSDAFSSQGMLSDSEQLDLLQWFKLHGATAPLRVESGGGDGRVVAAVGCCLVTMAYNDLSTVESAAAVNDARLLFEWLRREYKGGWLHILRSLLIDCASNGDLPTIDASLAAGIDFAPVLRGAIDDVMYGTLDYSYENRDTALEMLFYVIKQQNILAACIPAICRMVRGSDACTFDSSTAPDTRVHLIVAQMHCFELPRNQYATMLYKVAVERIIEMERLLHPSGNNT
jgi:hypothetical protein